MDGTRQALALIYLHMQLQSVKRFFFYEKYLSMLEQKASNNWYIIKYFARRVDNYKCYVI